MPGSVPNVFTSHRVHTADGKHCHVHELYGESAALVSHPGMFGERFAECFLQVFEPVLLVVYGTPDGSAKEAPAPFGPVHMQRAGGFAR